MKIKISKWLAYETGVHVGDGNMYSYSRIRRITFSGNLKNEKEYYKKILPKIIKRVYKLRPIYIERTKDNTVILIVNSKDLVEFKNRVLGLPIGKKDEIRIPEIIMKNQNLVKWFMRGLGDTDFSLSFKKDRKGIHKEPRLELYSKSGKLIRDIESILRKFNFTFSIEEKTGKYHGFMIRIYGIKNLENWIKTFGFSNPWVKIKIKVWKKLGYFPIKKSYPEYLQLLNKNVLSSG